MAEKITYTAKILSSLSKVFLDEVPSCDSSCTKFTALQGEVFSFVTAYFHSDWLSPFAKVHIDSPLAPWCRIREVKNVPSAQPVRAWTDDNYLRTQPGLYPDLLSDLEDGRVLFSANRYKSLWVDVLIPPGGPSGDFDIRVIFTSPEGKALCHACARLTVFAAALAPQTLLHSEWFHGDCLADYYAVDVFSEQHWKLMENFISTAAMRGCNMILTPQFTPPLDTAVGGDRTTIQLVDVSVNPDGSYSFHFDRLQRWVDMCHRCGILYFEMSHLFTQWGASHPPKIMAHKDGRLFRLFGWEDPAVSGEYTRFLRSYLPALTRKLREWEIDAFTRFHISDEPEAEHISSYLAARDSVAPFLEGYIVMDAVSDLSLYQRSGISCPVCANNALEPFLEESVRPLWSYYCTAQFLEVSNRFMSMPSLRCRIYGMQIFKYQLEGILHWGYNFYNSKHSLYHLNPYFCTDAGGVFPSGDAFLVYPGKDGIPEESIRLMTMCHAMQDVRAMEQLARIKGRDFVIALLEEDLSEPLTFRQYPKSDAWFLRTRNRINEELWSCISAQ